MIDGVHSAYQRLQDKLKDGGKSQFKLKGLERVAVAVTAQPIERDELDQEFRELVQHSGWVRLQSATYRTGDGQEFGLNDGRPLLGEWVLSKTASAHLRQNSVGGWTLFRYQEHASLNDAENALAGDGTARDCLRERTSVIAADPPANAANPDYLAYDVYWGLENGAMRRLFARFVGFTSKNDG